MWSRVSSVTGGGKEGNCFYLDRGEFESAANLDSRPRSASVMEGE